MKSLHHNLTIVNFLFIAGLLVPALAASQAPKRLHSNIDDSQTFILKGDTRPAVESGSARDQGAVAGSQNMPRMSLHFAMTAAQQKDLAQLLTAQQDRRSPQYRKFLTPEEYADRFGVNSADIAKVTLWLENNGFSNVQVARGRSSIGFSGTAAQAQAAFHTAIHNFSLNGEPRLANVGDPQLPKALAGMVEHVRGLHNFRLQPHLLRPHPHFTSDITSYTFLAPDDWETIYDVKPLYSAGLDGSPIPSNTYSIAVVGQSDIQLTDLHAFRAAAGLPVKDPTTVVPPGLTDPGMQSSSGDEVESDLDLEWAGAIAKNANILFVTAQNVTDAITYAIDNNVAPILSTSYGSCEASLTPGEFRTQNAQFQQANAQGMTIVAAAGDVGAADCDTGANEMAASQGLAVDFPASSPFVTGIGGTTFTGSGVGTYFSATNNSSNGSANSYIPEMVWKDQFQNATGGGASILFSKPSWQTGTGVPNDGARDVPDIAFAASPNHDGYLICSAGRCVNGFRNTDAGLDVSGGTSVGPPSMAGVLALLVQQTGSRLGNINPNLYSLASVSANAFHDIISGDNMVNCLTGTPNCPVSGEFGYSAGAGYDQTTGWGSLDVANFVNEWPGDIQISATPNTVTVQPGTSATATITIQPQKNFSGTVSFSCAVPNSLANVTCSIPGTVTTSGTATLTITAATSASTPFVHRFNKVPPAAIFWLLAGLALSTALYALDKKRPAYAWSAVAVFAMALSAVSCGGGSSSGSSTGSVGPAATGPAESGTIVVTATSGMIVNTIPVIVSVT